VEVAVYRTGAYNKWLDGLRDKKARDRILARVRRLTLGNASDSKRLSGGISELRIHYSKGYRVYYAWHEAKLLLLLVGGNKATQNRDITMARKLLKSAIKELEQ